MGERLRSASALGCWWCDAPATWASPSVYGPHCDVCRAAHQDAERFLPLASLPAGVLGRLLKAYGLKPEKARAGRLEALARLGRGRAPWWYRPSPSPTEGGGSNAQPCLG